MAWYTTQVVLSSNNFVISLENASVFKKMIVRNRKGDSIWTVSLPMFVIFCFYFSVRILLWRFASNRQTAVATAAFRDSTRPLMGMRIA